MCALTLLSMSRLDFFQNGYPCLFYADYYGAQYKDKGRDGNEYEITIPSHRFLIDKFLYARKTHSCGSQDDYFDHPNCIGWVRTGDTENPGAMAVVLSNGEAGTKRMKTDHPNGEFVDLTGHVTESVVADSEGHAEFRCPARSVSVWVPKS